MRGDEVGEEGIEENGQEQWEGKVEEAILIIDVFYIIFKNPCRNDIIFKNPCSNDIIFKNPCSNGIIFKNPCSNDIIFKNPCSNANKLL